MHRYWTTAIIDQAQALFAQECLRDGVRVPVLTVLKSISAATMNKDFNTHAPGGSDG